MKNTDGNKHEFCGLTYLSNLPWAAFPLPTNVDPSNEGRVQWFNIALASFRALVAIATP
jgi:hypothetical protein